MPKTRPNLDSYDVADVTEEEIAQHAEDRRDAWERMELETARQIAEG